MVPCPLKTVNVLLKDNSYSIKIGSDLEEIAEKFFSQHNFSRKAMIVTDTNVGKLYSERVEKLLQKCGFEPEVAVVEAGENSKCLRETEKLYTRASEAHLDRHSPIIALGGGVIGDLAGFAASTYMRGVPLIHIPTSMLSQVDSSIGGKVGVNHNLFKNLIGSFYQPRTVFIDINFLQTLPQREISTGLAEIIKYGMIYDKDFFTYLEKNVDKLLQLDPQVLMHAITRSCEIKALIVSIDEKESDLRSILNFGHSFGHAIEKETQYAKYNHGEAVAAGMVGASIISCEKGLLSKDELKRLHSLLERCRLPQKCSACTENGIYHALFHDKKVVNGKLKWVIPDRIGRVHLDTSIDEKSIRSALNQILL